uniref:Uncharacterized protein n=1 Tax=Rhizophora mucronata TaxID=61149 RepID=A0A2P2NZD3_RHIMU
MTDRETCNIQTIEVINERYFLFAD